MKLKCAIDTRDETVKSDENAVGVYLWGKEGRQTGLVGHLPIEILKLMKQFLDADKNSLLMTTLVEKIKEKLDLSSLLNTAQLQQIK